MKGRGCERQRCGEACQRVNRSVGRRPRQRKSRSLSVLCYTKQALLTPSSTCSRPARVEPSGDSVSCTLVEFLTQYSENAPRSTEPGSPSHILDTAVVVVLRFYER